MLEVVGNYQLLKKLASGGMAEVFLARQVGLGGFSKLVAFKRILPGLVSQQRFVQMFLDEARVAASFNHPNIVQIIDLGRAGDHFFIAMEYIHGEDVKSIIRKCSRRKTRVPIEHVVKVLSGVLDGLSYAHGQRTLDGQRLGVVHRDVSPHNIIVAFHGGVKLIDFGIAKARKEASAKVTRRVEGKLAYLSPEQVRCEEIDGRSDVFTVGIVLYELLTWTRLFKRRDPIETLRAVCQAPIRSPKMLNPGIDRELESIVMRALERDLASRYQSALQMQVDLEDYLVRSGLRSNPVLIGEFLAELFSDKLAAQQEALHLAHAGNLDAIVIEESSNPPDLVAFLDMFFTDSASTSYRTSSLSPGLTGRILERPADHARAASAASLVEVSTSAVVPLASGLLSEREIFEAYAAEIDPLGAEIGKRRFLSIALVALVVCATLVFFGLAAWVSGGKEPGTGLVKVVSTPTGADVFLDGVRQETRTPIEISGIPVGQKHQLEVIYPGLPGWRTNFTINKKDDRLLFNAILGDEAEARRGPD